MLTECSPALFALAPVEGRRVVAGFNGGAITSNTGALLLGATDRASNLINRFAACFHDARTPERLEHAPAGAPGRYHRIGHDAAAIEGLFVDLFLDAHSMPPFRQVILDIDATDVPLHGHRGRRTASDAEGRLRLPRLQ